MKKLLQKVCIENNEARLYDFLERLEVKTSEDVTTLAMSKCGDLYVNEKFLKENERFTIGLLLHESLHLYLNHLEQEYKNHTVANIAQDIIINDYIDQINYELPEGALRYEAFDVPRDLTTSREVYKFLMDNLDKISEEQMTSSDEQHDFEGEEEITKEILNKIQGLFSDVEYQIYKNNKKKNKLPQQADFIKKISKILGRFLAPDFVRNYARQSRFRQDGIILAASRGYIRKPSLSIYLDISYSMEGENIKKAVETVNSLKVPLGSYNKNYYTFNTKTEKVDNFKEVNIGGGTNFGEFHTNDRADVVIIITDCEFSFDFLEGHNRKSVILIGVNTKVNNIKNCEIFSS